MAEKDLIQEALEQAKAAEEHEDYNRRKHVEDLEFVFSEDQWDSEVRIGRGKRATLNANDLPVFLDQVVGAQRANRTGIKVLPVDSDTDPDKAEIVAGLVRNIEHVSDADVAYDTAIEAAAAGGYMGAIRVITQYENEDLFDGNGKLKGEYSGDALSAFNQEIRIVPVENPVNVLFDPDAKLWHRNDGMFCFS